MSVHVGLTEDIERELGAQVKALRLSLNVDQASLAKRANVSLGALKNLENGHGSTLRTLVRVARALDRLDWLLDFHREPTVSPIARLRAEQGIKRPRRASPRRGPS